MESAPGELSTTAPQDSIALKHPFCQLFGNPNCALGVTLAALAEAARDGLRLPQAMPSSPKTPRGCWTPPEVGKGLLGRPRQISGLDNSLHMFARAGPVKSGRWVSGDPAISWSPVTP